MDYPYFAKYLPVSERDINWQIYCPSAGHENISRAVNYPTRATDHPPKYLFDWSMGRVFDEFQLHYIPRGTGVLRTGLDRKYRINAGNAFMLFPGIWHWYMPDTETGWDEYWVGFNGSLPGTLLRNGFFSPEKPVFKVGLHDSILQHYLSIFQIAENELPGFQQQLGSMITQLLALVTSFAQQEGHNNREEQLVQKAKVALQKHVYDDVDMESLSVSLGLGYSRLSKIFKRYTGLSPHQYYLQLKINRAKELLQAKQYSIKEVAFRLSFENPYYFSRIFKKKTGLSPSAWH